MRKWLELACAPEVTRRSLRVAMVVGTLLALINHGPALASHDITAVRLLQIVFTYLVPYGVSTYSRVEALLAQ